LAGVIWREFGANHRPAEADGGNNRAAVLETTLVARVMTENDIKGQLGPFDKVEPVGSPSGSGECWRVERQGTAQALKVIAKNPEPERFEREVEALKRVNSPRIVDVQDYGDDLKASDGTAYPYLISEFIEGGDVRGQLASGSIPDDTGLRAFLDGSVEGIEVLHDQHIIHRDIKPENVILRNGSWAEPVIIDLGLSRLLDLTTLTVYPWAGGTWPYMAPEQLRGERAIDRTDLWALAVVAGELASGQHPFWRGETSPPPDWDRRLQGGVTVPGTRPAGLRDFVSEAGNYAAYRRPSAVEARQLLNTAWPP
jgi:serine/threonine protein kinase